MNDSLSRRTVLQALGGASMTVALAGCSGGGGGGGDDGGGGSQFLESEPDYEGWFEDVDNYEQTRNLTGQDSVTISVGAGDNGLRFDPPAIAVDAGTTIVWEWTGEGGGHNVAGENREFESETVTEGGHTYEQTVSETGIVKYFCTPHRALGMKGAIVVQ
ncbi:halocyanin domain-containing protein [Halonotius terrestris]|uniref:Halocyanin domain-containing protein n=1 Tax=Halonotius terrestris TaxID=2487750 RepID=A0A8J8P9P3_9EURY|nr:halocyanin domain-containing protein [Halonotius terrestris]TQQ83623.1 halocyanin domain-containing protein [Halonotius terrestris]